MTKNKTEFIKNSPQCDGCENCTCLDNMTASNATRGKRRHSGVVEECISIDGDILSEVIIPTIDTKFFEEGYVVTFRGPGDCIIVHMEENYIFAKGEGHVISLRVNTQSYDDDFIYLEGQAPELDILKIVDNVGSTIYERDAEVVK